MNTDIDKYMYMVRWSEEDQEFVGLCAEFPFLSYLDPDMDAAIAGIKEVVSDCVGYMRRDGDAVPIPIIEREAGDFPAQRHAGVWVEYSAVSHITPAPRLCQAPAR